MASIDMEVIKKTIYDLKYEFSANELADFSLKMKNESLIRNKIKEMWSRHFPNLNIYPEYKRVDLVVLENWTLNTIIEFKAFYTIDGFKRNIDFFDYNGKASLLKDFDKNKKILENNSNKIDQYQVIIVTNPQKPIPAGFKYPTSRNKISHYDDIDNMINICRENIHSIYNKSEFIIEECTIDAGIAFDIPVNLYFWIIKKIG